ncbi:hypothetical protein I6N95_05045 [Vagococcus sp. BWB3-3]|uniref:Uncharacterized protein n=1 Tax=Vagococcus allomyrinae TaxID=2794353 RepID=A0A940SUT4_9ENTE|nr:hypothetical protein [Vagococcus allomyrinae]MBP1040376.1 hypothetical protein [Vagococcus allomyrinae]
MNKKANYSNLTVPVTVMLKPRFKLVMWYLAILSRLRLVKQMKKVHDHVMNNPKSYYEVKVGILK